LKMHVKGGEVTVTSCNKGNSDCEQGKNLFPTGDIKHRNRLLRDVVESVLGDFQNSAKQVPLQSDLTVKLALSKRLD